MTTGTNRDEDSVEDVVEAIVAQLGLPTVVETQAATDEHAAVVAGLIADAAAERSRFEDTLDAS